MSQWACDPRSICGRTLYPRLKGASGHVLLGVHVAELYILGLNEPVGM